MSERKKGYLEILIAIIILLTVIFILDIATQSVFIIVGVIVLFNIFIFELILLINRIKWYKSKFSHIRMNHVFIACGVTEAMLMKLHSHNQSSSQVQ